MKNNVIKGFAVLCLLYYTILKNIYGINMSLISEKTIRKKNHTYISDIGQSLGNVIEYTSEIKQGQMESLQEGEGLLKNRK